MLEVLLCSLFTVLPDYLYRRYVQGKRIGRDINLYSVWYELRWGITTCLILTISLITLIFYFHPSTKSSIAFFRTVPLLPESNGRVEEVYVELGDQVKAGQPIFRLDGSEEEAALESARRRVAEIDAQMEQAVSELAAADGKLQEAESAYQQALDELETRQILLERNVVARREVERLQRILEGRQGGVNAAVASKKAIEVEISLVLPAQKASAEAARQEAQVELDKTVVHAGVDGTVEQFGLRKGDVVNPMIRTAGVLVPSDAGRRGLWAGFGQIEAQVMKVGMVAEVTCIAKPFTIIPMVVTQVQGLIAAGQVRPTDQLIDAVQAQQPGTIMVFLEPLYEGGFAGVPPGGQCIANAYTSNHDRLDEPGLGAGQWVFLHVVDTVALVHAMILRVQALLLPVQTLVLGGH